tara:strand:- start:44 stop:361 length:318 start_codon:yes stop_codon:yes gene_type:complete
MNSFRWLLSTEILLVPICILAIGLLPLPTPFYDAVRLSVFIFGVAAFLLLPKIYSKEKVIFLLLAVIYNPIFPVYFGSRLIWWPINAFALFMFWKLRNEVSEYES